MAAIAPLNTLVRVRSNATGATFTGTVTSFNATNTTSGNISLTNTAAPLTITGVSQAGGGNLAVTNVGGITVSGVAAVAGAGEGIAARV